MTAQEIKKHIQAQPFIPFNLHVADGRVIPVAHRDFILVSPRGRLVDVYQSDDDHDILDIYLITSVSFRQLATNGNAQQHQQPTPPNAPSE